MAWLISRPDVTVNDGTITDWYDLLVIGAAFVVLAWVTRRRSRRLGLPALEHLAGVLLVVGVVGLLGALADRGTIAELVIIPIFTGLMLYPLAMLRFVDGVAPVRPLIRQIAAVGAAFGFVLLGAYVVLGESNRVMRGLGELETLVVLPALVALAHVVSWRAISAQARRLGSAFTMKRARALNLGLAGLGLGIVAALWRTDVGLLLAFLAAVVLAFATAPPRWLRIIWLVPDLDAIDVAEADYLSRPGDRDALGNYVAAVNRVVDGITTWVVKDGRVIVEAGDPAPTQLRLQQPWDGDRDLSRLTDGRWLLQVRTRGVVLRVLTADDPVMFGLHESTLFDRVAARLAVALEREQYEDEHRQVALLLQEADHLRRMATLKDDVLSTLSHELRTPLTIVSGNAELMTTHWERMPDDQRRTLVRKIQQHAATLTRTVEDTLRLARLRAGDVAVHTDEVDLRALVTAEVAATDLGQRGRVSIDVPAVAARLDVLLVGDLVGRLLSNALKHSAGAVAVTGEVDGADLLLRVHDHGNGFGDVDTRELFTPFNRGGDVLHRRTRGMGMGLAVAAATAHVIGADLDVEETSEEGSTLRVRFPGCVVATHAPALD